MAREGVQDYLAAKRKAATRLGISELRFLPRNLEIKDALAEYQQLFQSVSQPQHLRELRETALNAMRLMERFEPRLVGDVLSGSATRYSNITLHLFSDIAEDIPLFLEQEQIPFQPTKKRLRITQHLYKEYPAFQLTDGEHRVNLVVFPYDGMRQSPCSPLDGKPMQRANLTAVEEILGVGV